HPTSMLLVPISVSSKLKHLAFVIPEHKSKNAVQLFNEFDAPLFISVHQDFGIGPRSETMTGRQQLFAQGWEIVNLSVESYPNGFILIRHRLMARAAQVNDAQPPMAKRHWLAGIWENPNPRIIWPAVPNEVGHSTD